MDVRSIEAKAPVVEHNGTVPVWWMIESREFKDITDGGFLELVNEFEVPGGGLVDPHSHPTHEFYYVMNGKGTMTIDGEDREISQGDLVYIPPDKVHSLRPISDRFGLWNGSVLQILDQRARRRTMSACSWSVASAL